eukprot:TRINITY_DN28365_c0_g1_i1.p1 TRINITY_DN28365_c0_g1~~TRINITY_DN28365_c0_g1_i1.p1  ORF type:complete len:266 (-),score=58.82 TRINITY_DN28365_c0_g1_i1:14-811(-)
MAKNIVGKSGFISGDAPRVPGGAGQGLRLEINIVSDIICPWCFMAKRRLEKALKDLMSSEGFEATVHWRPWLLAPRLPKDGITKLEMYQKRFRNDETRMSSMFEAVSEAGKTDGITFTFDGKVGPTMDAHRLLWMLQARTILQNKLAEELFIAYHERGECPSQHNVLLSCVERLGEGEEAAQLRAQASQLLSGQSGESEVRKDILAAHEKWDMLGGVPHVHVKVCGHGLENHPQPGLSIPGAQDSATFLRVLQRASQLAKTASNL